MKKNTADKNRKDLAKLMTERRAQVETLLRQVQAGVDATVAGHKADPANWGYAGNLGHTIEILDSIAKFLGQKGVS